MKLTIWLVLDSGKIGGIESHVVQLAKYLHELQYKVCVIFLNDYSQQSVAKNLAQAKIKCIFLNGSLSAFYQLVKKSTPDILHAHSYKPGIYCKLLAKLIDTSVICTHHPGDRGKGRIYCYNLIDEYLACLASYNIAVSDAIAKRIPCKKLAVIPNFVAVPTSLNPLDKTPHYRIGFFGRFHHEKGPDLFCQLNQYLPKEIKLEMFGDGEELEAMQSQYSESVTFHGAVDNIEPYLSSVDLVCLTSRTEGLPLIALEAMAQGIPVVTFAVGGLPSLITHGMNGYLVTPNDLKSFANTIVNYYQNSYPQRLLLRDNAYQTIQTAYSPQILGAEIEKLYQSLR